MKNDLKKAGQKDRLVQVRKRQRNKNKKIETKRQQLRD